ncbi:MAG TPA: ester cyclase [Herpetosiphonaceae bacterium]|nr:ester cyclase [Herpetosiphonaceae bacterium]
MSLEANKAAIRHHIATLAAGSLAATGDHAGLEAIPLCCQRTIAAFGDDDVTINELVAEDNWVVARLTWRGTHRSEWMGMAATGRRVSWEVIAMFQLVAGSIVHIHGQADVISLMLQLSASPERST